MAWGGYNLTRFFSSTEADQRLTRQLNTINREYDEITRSLPSFGVGGSTMRDAVTFYNQSIRGFPSIGEFLRPLSLVLQQHPNVRMGQLAWQATDNAKTTPVLGASSSRSIAPSVRAVAKTMDAAADASAPDAANPPFAGGRYQVALIEATVHVPNNDFRGATRLVDELAADIGKQPGFHADVVEPPLDVRPSFSLQGRHAEREKDVMEPRFVLRIVREKAAP